VCGDHTFRKQVAFEDHGKAVQLTANGSLALKAVNIKCRVEWHGHAWMRA